MYKVYPTTIYESCAALYKYCVKMFSLGGSLLFRRKLIAQTHLTFLILLLSLVHVFAFGYPQEFSYKADYSSADRLFSEIRKQTGYTVLYSGISMNNIKFSDIDFNNSTLKEVLYHLSETQ